MTTSYTIQMASKISGVGVHTIRAWEKRYQALTPTRDALGHRTYTKTDIEKLMLLSELCLLGYSISKVAAFDIPELKKLLTDLGKTDTFSQPNDFNLIKEKISINAVDSTGILKFAVQTYKLDVIHQEMLKLKTNITARELVFDILLPLALELNELKAKSLYSSAQEEAIVSLLKFHSGSALHTAVESNERSKKRILLIGLLGNLNGLDLVMAGLLCQYYGFNLVFIDSQISVEAINDLSSFLNSELIIFGVLNTTSIENYGLSHVQNLIEKFISKDKSNSEILLNGKMELDQTKFETKKFKNSKTIIELDKFLSSQSN